MSTTPLRLLIDELSTVEWDLNAIANPIDWRSALEIGELNFPRAQELLAKFYDLEKQIEGDVFFLNLLVARGGSTKILSRGPSEQVQTLIDQGLCSVSPEPDLDYTTVAITEQGRAALQALQAL